MVWLFIGLVSFAVAQPADKWLEQKHYDLSSGLSHQHVYQVFQDSRGVIWLVTANGLSAFDGAFFFQAIDWSLPKAPWEVSVRTEDSEGRIWVRIIQDNDIKFEVINLHTRAREGFSKKLPPSISEDEIADVSSDESKKMLISTRKGEIWQQETGTKWKLLNRDLGACIHFCGSQQSEKGIWLSDYHFPFDSITFKSIGFHGKVNSIKTIKDAKTWSVTSNKTLWVFNGLRLGILDRDGNIHWVNLADEVPELNEISEVTEKQITFDSKRGHIWMRIKGKLLLFDVALNKLIPLKDPSQHQPGPNCFQIFVDTDGNTWSGSMEGLTLSRITNSRFFKINWIDPKINAAYFKNATRGITESSDGQIYFESSNKILSYNRSTKQIQEIVQKPVGITPLIKDAESHSFWFFLDNVKQYDTENMVLNQYPVPTQMHPGITWSALDMGQKILWGRDNGLFYFDKKSQSWTPFTRYNGFEQIKKADIYHIQKESEEQVWVLSNIGLFLLHPEKGIIRKLGKSEKGENYLPAENFRHYYRDDNGIYWFATARGLLKWNPLKSAFRLYNTNDGLSNNNLYAVYADKSGFLWASSDYGINQFHPGSEENRYFLVQDGITHNEFNRISHFKTSDGFLFFGSLNGITWFNPVDFYYELQKPGNKPIVLMSAYTSKSSGKVQKNLLKDFFRDNMITLQSNERNLTLQLGFPDYQTIGNTEFSYRLEGIDTAWIRSRSSEIQLAGMGYGRHTLLVRAITRNGSFSSAEQRIPFMVLRPVFLQGWFIFLLFALVGVGIYILIQQRIRKIEFQKKQLEAEVARRTAKIMADKEIIEKQSNELKQREEEKSRFFNHISHEFRTPLALILGPVKHLRKRTDAQPREKEMLDIALNNANRLLEMVNSILFLSRIENRKFTPSFVAVSPLRFMENLQTEFMPLAYERKIDLGFQLNFTQDTFLELDPSLLRIILDNLLSNAFKFTPEGGSVQVMAQLNQHNLIIKVSDSGVGIPDEKLPRIFESFYQVDNSPRKGMAGSGIGLALASELAALMNGHIYASNKPGKGAIFTLEISAKYSNVAPDLISSLDEQDQTGEIIASPIPRASLLIVEDNPEFQKFLELLLGEKFTLRISHNPVEAFQALEEGYLPSLIISDVMMPQMDGFTFLEQLKKNPLFAPIPVLMLTARTADEYQLKAMQLGVDDYIVKPFEEEILLAAIIRLLQRYVNRFKGKHEEDVDAEHTDVVNKLGDIEWLEKLQSEVNQNLHKTTFSVDELAGLMLMGRTAFYKKVQRHTGLTPNQYIMEARLVKARFFLETEPRLTIKNLLPRIGLKHEEHFNKVFKERFGKSPAHYKKENS